MKHRLLIISLLLTSLLFAEFKSGERLPQITLPDQFDNTLQLKASDRLIIMAFEKEVSSAINAYLKTKPENHLEKNHTRYISDISAMPSFVTSMFALPKMKKYPFSIMLINDDFGQNFSRKEGKITVYRIDNYRIKKIEYLSTDKLPALFQ